MRKKKKKEEKGIMKDMKNKNEKGITLVALVITIIILIILAAVTINLTLGENGLITKAKSSATIYKDAQVNEISQLDEIVNYINSNGTDIDYTLYDKYLVNVNPIIDSISTENTVDDFTFDIYLNDSDIIYKENLKEFSEELFVNTKIRVVANSVNGYTTSFDETTILKNTNITIQPKWTINKYDFNFNTNGGSAIEKQTIQYGSNAIMPENPTKENHRFLGWYSNADLTNKFDFNTTIKANTNIYAKWIATTDTPLIQICIYYEKDEGKTTLIYTDENGQEQTVNPTSDGEVISVTARKNTNFYLVSAYGSNTEWSINTDQFEIMGKQIGTTDKIHFVVPDVDISFNITGKYSRQTRLRKINDRNYNLTFIKD